MDAEAPFRDQLFAAGLLIPSGVDGLYGRSGRFDDVLNALGSLITRLGAEARPEVMRFPPATSRSQIERSGYLKGFPQLAGSIHCFCGDDAQHREMLRCIEAGQDWTATQVASEVMLNSAACYSVYPVLSRRGTLPAEGALVDVEAWCFRHEPSLEPTRQLMFRMREYVRVGAPDQVLAFRQHWLDTAGTMMQSLELPHHVDVANDPFFGRGGRMMRASQREQELKFEVLVPVNDGAGPTACLSCNYHQNHFSQVWPLLLPDGTAAHSACVGFGMERLTLALFRHHGLQPDGWPAAVRAVLWP